MREGQDESGIVLQQTQKIVIGFHFADVFFEIIVGVIALVGTKVAIKESKMRIMNRQQQQKVKEEADILQPLQHENIVNLIESFFHNQVFYIVLELATGGDLDEQIDLQRSKGQWTKAFISNWFTQLLCGLEYLHGKKIMHRDLKPKNILLGRACQSKSSSASEPTDQYVLKITDFGLARVTGASGIANTICGTQLYMSPETLSGATYSFGSDIWGLGCVFYEICMLKRPFRNLQKLFLVNHSRSVPQICATADNGEDWNEFRYICSQMLSLEQADRPSCSRLRVVLEKGYAAPIPVSILQKIQPSIFRRKRFKIVLLGSGRNFSKLLFNFDPNLLKC